MKKKIIIVAVAVVVILAAWIVYAVWNSYRSGGTVTPSGGAFPVATTTIPAESSSSVAAPTSTSVVPPGTSFQIGTSQGTVTVHNFYKTAAYITQDQQTVALVENDTYLIDYNRDDSGFIIDFLSLSGSSLQTVRAQAEAAFLNQLGISQSDACKLTVNERVLDQNSPYDGQLMGLSFCGPGISQ